MDQRINWEKPEKPPEMNFARIACLVLGGAGLAVAAFVAMMDKSVAAFLVFGLIFGVMFCMGLVARPRRWFSAADEIPDGEDPYNRPNTPWWKRTVDREYRFGNKPFVPLSKVDYVLLCIVFLVNLLVAPVLIPILPRLGAIQGWFVPACVIVSVPLFCAYLWQLRVTNHLRLLSPLFMFFIGVLIYSWGYHIDDRDTMVSGVLGLGTGFWSGIRLVTLGLLQKGTA